VAAVTVKRAIHACCPSVLRPTLAKIESSEIGYRLARGAFWSMTGAVISRGLGLVSFVVVARTLGKVGFGELGIINSTVALFQVFAGFGLGLTATKYVAEYRKCDPQRAGRIIGLAWMVSAGTGGLCAVLLVAFAPWLAAHALAAPHLSGLLRITALALFISALNAGQNGALSGFEAFKTIATRNLIAGLLDFPIMVAGVLLAGLDGAIWAVVASHAVNWFICHLAVRREARRLGVPLALSGCLQELPLLWRFSLPAVLSGLMVTPVIWLCNAMLVNQPNGYAEMGIYNAVLRVKQVPEMVLMMLVAPLLPMLSEYFGKGDTKSYNKILSYAFALSLCIVVPVSLIQAAVPTLTLLPYGQEYQGHTNVVQWLMLHAVLIGLFQPFGGILASMNRMWFGFTYNLSWGAVFLALIFLLAPRYGAAGLAAAFALTHLVTSLFCVAYIYRCEKAFIVDTPLAYYALSVSLLLVTCIIASHCVPPFMAGGIGCATALALVLIIMHMTKVRRVRTASIISTEPFTGE